MAQSVHLSNRKCGFRQRALPALWPSPFTSQIENVGLDSAHCPLSRRTGKALFEKDRQAPHAACAHEIVVGVDD